MPGITRRDITAKLALGAAMGSSLWQSGCVFVPGRGWVCIFGSAGSGIDAFLAVVGLIVAAGRGARRAVNLPPLTGALAGVATGPAPPQATKTQDTAVYLLDNLGDNTSDGRVFALNFREPDLGYRGQVSLREPIFNGPSPGLRDIVLSPDGSQILVSQAGSPAQWIFVDTATLTITGRLMCPPDTYPRRAVFSPDGKRAYAACTASASDIFPPAAFTLQILDTAAFSIVGSLAFPPSAAVSGMAITPDGGLLLAAGLRLLHVIDLATVTYSGNIDLIPPLGVTTPHSGEVTRILIDPSGERLYAAIRRNPSNDFNVNNPAVGVIDVRSAVKVAEYPVRLPTGGIGLRIALSPLGVLYAGFQRGGEVQVFDTTTGQELTGITLPANFGFADLAGIDPQPA